METDPSSLLHAINRAMEADGKNEGTAKSIPASSISEPHDPSVSIVSNASPKILKEATHPDPPQKVDIDPLFLDVPEIQDETTVDEMKIQTMYKMVEDVSVVSQGKDVTKKLLYLTNKQAVLFDEEAIARCIQALDIGEPKFVIMLLPSLGVRSQMKIAHPERLHTADCEYKASNNQSSEIDPSDERIVEERIILFMRTCILPLAQQTRAVILVSGANDCFLSAALANVVLSEQARLGKDCPFTVIATAFEFEVHSRAVSPNDRNSIASQLARGCRSWSRRMPTIHRYVTNTWNLLQRCDLTPAASRYIVFEAFDEGRGTAQVNCSIKKSFEAVFVQCLTRKLPSIAIQSHKIDSTISHLSELAARNIPVLLLDSFERIFSMRNPLGNAVPRTKLAAESASFPEITRDRIAKIDVCDNSITLPGRYELLKIAMESIERKWQCQIAHGCVDFLDAAMLAFFHSALLVGAELEGSAQGENVPLYVRIRELEKFARTNKDSKQARMPPDLVASSIDFILNRSEALKQYACLSKAEKWIATHNPERDCLMKEAIRFLDNLKTRCAKIDASGGFLHSDIDSAIWLSHFDLLSSPNTFSGSIHDLDGLKRILGSVAKIDRLPSTNSLEALKTLQDAWDHFETYQSIASSYKRISKMTYSLVLLTGILVTFFSLCESQFGVSSRIAIMILSFVGTGVAAYVSFTNPAVRWQQLRMAAVSIESNIWVFRTRSGIYRTSGGEFNNTPDLILSETIREIKDSVLQGADLKNTAFFSRNFTRTGHGQHQNAKLKDSPGNDYRHDKVSVSFFSWATSNKRVAPNAVVLPGKNSPVSSSISYRDPSQNDSNLTVEEVIAWLRQHDSNEAEHERLDRNYSPVQPDVYLRFRVHKAIVFYQRRIPRCHRVRNLAQFFLVASSIAAGALAFLDRAVWASAVSIVTSAVTAYIAFQGTNNKISRYSATVHALQGLVIWWETLPPIDRSVVSNVDRLVLTCEELLHREQQAWRSTSQVVKMLQKQTVGPEAV